MASSLPKVDVRATIVSARLVRGVRAVLAGLPGLRDPEGLIGDRSSRFHAGVWVGGNDSILARGLGFVHGFVGSREKLIPMMRADIDGRYADAHGEAGWRVGSMTQGVVNALSDRGGLVGGKAWEDEGEFFSAESYSSVAAARAFTKNGANEGESFVSSDVTKIIVPAIKVIHIHQDQVQWKLLAGSSQEHTFDAGSECSPIGETGQGIGGCEAFELRIGLGECLLMGEVERDVHRNARDRNITVVIQKKAFR